MLVALLLIAVPLVAACIGFWSVRHTLPPPLDSWLGR
jgi:hypothetical protein